MKLRTISFNNLKRRKGKTVFLTIGLLIGITTVVTLLSITKAMKADIQNKIDEFGANMVVVPKSDDLALSYGGITVSSASYDVRELNEKDAAKIRTIRNRENINVVAPKLLGATEVEGNQVLLVGVRFPEELKLKKWWTIKGAKPMSSADVLLGSQAARKLGKNVGDPLSLGGREFRVVGILKETGSQEDSLIYADLEQTQSILNKPGKISMIEVSAWCTTCPIEKIVAQTRRVLPHAKVTALKFAVEARKNTVNMFSNFSLALSAVVLLIGSLIVLTTMMSSVNERTREIGIFRAIGFRRSHIMRIILLEAFIISLTSGILGYLLGIGGARLLAPHVAAIEVTVAWDPQLALGAVGLSILIGLAASFYPARRASVLDPVEALRSIYGCKLSG